MSELYPLQETLRFAFRDIINLRQALIHHSYLNENPGSTLSSNERLEYLGDALLSLVVAWELFKNFPDFSEGRLTKLRATLVCQESLARLARKLNLGRYLYLGRGEEKEAGRSKPRNLASALEAIIGAALVDQGFEAARELILNLLREELVHVGEKELENPCSKLQELVQAELKFPPTYQFVEVGGAEHHPQFTARALAREILLGEGEGKSKREAKRKAARASLENWPRLLKKLAGKGE